MSWHDIALRLVLSLIAGAIVGLDRGEHGRPAGLRTTTLVCLAAAVAMIQANLLLATNGKTHDSFVTFDVMRLPLGILTGVGFIGGGAILRRDGLVLGVTTAATLWFVTVIGLCFGGGQIRLGLAAFALAVMVLSGLHWVDSRIKQDQHGILSLTTENNEPDENMIRAAINKAGYKFRVASVIYCQETHRRQLEYRLSWRSAPSRLDSPAFIQELAQATSVFAVRWEMDDHVGPASSKMRTLKT